MEIPLIITLLITCACFSGIWLINVMTKDAGVIDYYWGPGFAVIAGIHLYMNGNPTVFEWVFFAAIVLWSARLAGYLISRHHTTTKEDGRYLEMRQSGGKNFWWKSLFTVFLLQALLLWMIAAPVHLAFSADFDPIMPLFLSGMIVFMFGFALEWVADRQLKDGKAEKNHSEADNAMFVGGLWGISRHPNYLGEIILWWGLAIAAFALSGSLIAFIGPALLMAAMIGVSIPLTEQHMVRTRPSYEIYMQRVPMLVPTKALGLRRDDKQPAE